MVYINLTFHILNPRIKVWHSASRVDMISHFCTEIWSANAVVSLIAGDKFLAITAWRKISCAFKWIIVSQLSFHTHLRTIIVITLNVHFDLPGLCWHDCARPTARRITACRCIVWKIVKRKHLLTLYTSAFDVACANHTNKECLRVNLNSPNPFYYTHELHVSRL